MTSDLGNPAARLRLAPAPLDRDRSRCFQVAEAMIRSAAGRAAPTPSSTGGDLAVAQPTVPAAAVLDELALWVGLLDACRDGNLSRVREFLAAGAPVDAQDLFSGHTPLHYAIESGSAELVALLLEHGADVEHGDNMAGHSPLASATLLGRGELVGLLLAAGADPARAAIPTADGRPESTNSNNVLDGRTGAPISGERTSHDDGLAGVGA